MKSFKTRAEVTAEAERIVAELRKRAGSEPINLAAMSGQHPRKSDDKARSELIMTAFMCDMALKHCPISSVTADDWALERIAGIWAKIEELVKQHHNEEGG